MWHLSRIRALDICHRPGQTTKYKASDLFIIGYCQAVYPNYELIMPPETSIPNTRVAIVGVGQVGSAAAYALILGRVADELLLVDVKAELRDAQVRDLSLIHI